MFVCAHSVVISQYYLFCCVERSGNIPGRESIVVDLTALGEMWTKILTTLLWSSFSYWALQLFSTATIGNLLLWIYPLWLLRAWDYVCLLPSEQPLNMSLARS